MAEAYELSEKAAEPEDERCRALQPAFLEKASDVIISSIERVFFQIGKLNGRFPIVAVAVGLVFFGLSATGYMKFEEDTEQTKLWTPESAPSVHDSKLAQQWFPTQARISRLIVSHAENVLTKELLLEAFTLDDSIKNFTVDDRGETKRWEDVCFKTGPLCLETSLLEIWSYDRMTLQSDEDILETINSASLSPVTNAPIDVESLMGGVKKNDDGEIEGAKALAMTYFISSDTIESDASALQEDWEQEFLDTCENGLSNLQVNYFATKSFGDIGGGAIRGDLPFLIVGYLLVTLFLSITLGMFNCRDQKVYIAIIGLACIVMSYGVSVGLTSWMGFKAGPLNSILPFLLLGIGVDDMFVFVAAWDNLPVGEHETMAERVAHMTKHAGVSILITSLTDIMAFGIGATTEIPALRSFCVFAAMGILGIFFLTLFFFVGCFVFDQKRAASNRNACCFCYNHGDDYEPSKCSTTPLSTRFFDKVLSRFLGCTAVKITVIICAASLFGVSTYGVTQIRQDFDPTWFIPSGNYFDDYLKIDRQYFPKGGESAYVYFGQIDYYLDRQILLDLRDDMANVEKVATTSPEFWMTSFQAYVSATDWNTMTEDNFYTRLQTFLTTGGGKYNGDINVNWTDTNPKISSSRMSFVFVKMEDSTERIEAMDSVRDVIEKLPYNEDDCFVFTPEMLSWDGDKVIQHELLRNVILACVCVFVVCLLLIANILTCLYVLVCVVATLVDVTGVLYFWGVTINTVSAIMIVLAIGLAVDYAAHIGHVFMICTGPLDLRVRRTLREIGSAVFNGGFSTFLAFIPLAASQSFVFFTFFQAFFLVCIFGLFHGLIFLPVVLSLIGPPPYLSAVRDQKKETPVRATSYVVNGEKATEVTVNGAQNGDPPAYAESEK